MLWFRKKEKEKDRHDAEVSVKLELERHRQARQKVATSAKEITEKFVKQVKDNGFTMTIYGAAGGKH